MKIKGQVVFNLFLLSTFLLSACGPGQLLGPTYTPMPTMTPVPTLNPTPDLSGPALIRSIPMSCADQAGGVQGPYRSENNTWGKGALTGWSQCIGLKTISDGSLVARWTWDWLNTGGNVKAYPEIIYGQKPGASTTSPDMPKKISSVADLAITYDITSTHTGNGNMAFDIWLTDTGNPAKFGVPPITHEIMIWLSSYGGMRPGGNWIEQVNLDGTPYDVYTAEKWGDGWTYIGFARNASEPGAGTLNLVNFLKYMRGKNLVTGDEYIASIELGNEVITGAGETILNRYAISVR